LRCESIMQQASRLVRGHLARHHRDSR
jgi:hypothetical protein